MKLLKSRRVRFKNCIKCGTILLFTINLLFVITGVSYADELSVKVQSEELNPLGISKMNSYDNYISNYESAQEPKENIVIPGVDFIDTDMQVEVLDDFEGNDKKTIRTSEEGYIEWEVNIDKEGLYNIGLRYYPIEDKSSAIERELLIDGQIPFDEARSVILQRIWKDASGIQRDNRGNDLSPKQIEAPMWQEVIIKDIEGYYNEPYKFFFSKGKHKIRLNSLKESMVIEYLKIFNEEEVKGYEELEKEYVKKGYKETDNAFVKIQAETPNYKSDPMLVPVYDRSSPATEPYDKAKIRLNILGGGRWSIPGEWASWNFEVPEDGLYKIALKTRQNSVRGTFVNRRLTIDGEVPFKEMGNVVFKYNSKWKMSILGEENPYLFYLTKGTHTLKLEVVLGDLSKFLRIADNSVYELNTAYRKIIMITGTSPDIYRDYSLEKEIPDVIETFKEQSEVLQNLSNSIQKRTGEKSSSTALLDTIAFQLRNMSEDTDSITRNIDNFKSNVGSLGTWIIDIKSQPLDLDYIIVAAPDKELPKADASFIRKIIHEIASFIASFTHDYNTIGNIYDTERSVTVWTGAGRDQANVLKSMIDSSFTPETGISVNLKLVQGALLQATVAGMGPDVALEVGNGDPVNYATRNAVVDLTQFPEFDEVSQRFRGSALVPYTFRDGIYALPERQTFPMMFYRKDILEQLKITVPQTWQDVYSILPVLQRVNMNMGIPVADTSSEMVTFGTLLYQNGGSFYKEDGIASNLDSELAINTFKKWVELYRNHKLPMNYDAANRFRTGEIPIVIADYTLYNTLTVFAPEIRGLWDFAPVPGTKKEDGTIDRKVPGAGTACIMLKQAKDKEAAWSFMEWLTRAESQVEFGRGMESLMGAAARYPTANIEALNQLPWQVKDYKNLSSQWEWVTGIPEVPGGYFTGRHLDNAFRQVIDGGDDPRETLLDYVRVINQEIKDKRIEFGLD